MGTSYSEPEEYEYALFHYNSSQKSHKYSSPSTSPMNLYNHTPTHTPPSTPILKDTPEDTPELKPIDDACYVPPLRLSQTKETNTSIVYNKIPSAYRMAAQLHKPRLISIEGNIGSGKSTFIQMLKDSVILKTIQERLMRPVVFVPEPVKEWETILDETTNETIIEKFYKDPDTYAFSFQMMAYITRIKLLQETIQKHPNAIIITERCIETDKNVFAQMLHDDEKISSIEFQIYTKWFDHFKKELEYNTHIYLFTNCENCHLRILNRNRQGEETIPEDYLKLCDRYHRQWLSQKTNVLTIDGNNQFHTNRNHFNHLLKQVLVEMNPTVSRERIYEMFASELENELENENKMKQDDCIESIHTQKVFSMTLNGC